MRILYLAPPHAAGDRLAAYTFLDEEILGLIDAGHDLYMVTFADPEVKSWPTGLHPLPVGRGAFWENLSTLLPVARALGPRPGAWRNWKKRLHSARIEYSLAELAVQEGLDLVHSHFGWPGGWGGALLARKISVPLVATMRGMDLQVSPDLGYGQRLDPGYEAALRFLVRTADVTTYGSQSMVERGIRFGANPERARVILKGVDVDQFQPARDRDGLKASLGVEGPLILSVAGLVPLKGIDVILHGLSRISTRDFTYVICGEGQEGSRLERLAATLGLGDRVRLVGWVPRDEIPRYFAACDVFVLGSRLDAAPNVVLEAMAAGRPVVTTDSGGPRDYVHHGTTGFVVPVDDAPAIGERIAQLLDSPDLADAMGVAGRRRIESRHAYGQMIRGFEDAYRAAIAHHGRGDVTSDSGSDAGGTGPA